VKYYIWSLAFYGAETWILWKVDQNSLESFEMWCWKGGVDLGRSCEKWRLIT